MKFSVAKDKLLEGMQTVQNVVSTRTTLPILSNVLIRAENGALSLTTNDLDVEVDGKNVASIRCGPSLFKMMGLPEDEFPALPKLENAKAFTLKQKDLK